MEAMIAEEDVGRKRGRQEMLARVEADTDKLMDNGVRINPTLREMMRRGYSSPSACTLLSVRYPQVPCADILSYLY